MSTPSPQQRISLPKGKAFTVLIDSPNYPSDYPGELTFSQDLVSLEWTAAYSVPSVELTELNCKVKQPGPKLEFGFTLEKVTEDQQKAGYMHGEYRFSFDPPGGGATHFSGHVKDPRPDQAEDTFTARGNEGPV
ncbi:MAG TPA: hypothetical protein VFH15_00465 [Pyrinomonadaceae bacterium]|nr:hypothetical protein [Pyrinomonadaceae bacterium]